MKNQKDTKNQLKPLSFICTTCDTGNLIKTNKETMECDNCKISYCKKEEWSNY